MMKKARKSLIAVLAVLVAAIMISTFFAACGGPKEPDPEDSVAVVTSLTLNTDNVKKTFDYGEAFTYNGLVITANLSDGTTEALPAAMCTISVPDTKSPGVKTVTVTYKNVKATYEVTVHDRVMPPISATPLAEITQADVYTVEAEDIDFTAVTAEEGTQIVVETEDEAVSGGKYVANYGVELNYFGFTFTADKEYTNATLVFNVANPTTRDLGLGTNMNIYMNYKSSYDKTQFNVADLTSLPVATVESGEEGAPETLKLEWATRVIRGVTIPAGTNTLTFDVLGGSVACIDNIQIYAGVPYGSKSITEISGKGTIVKDVEEFDLEKIVVRADVKSAHGLGNGVAFTETPGVNGANTHGGQSVGAMAKGSEITTALRLADKATIHIIYTTASTGTGPNPSESGAYIVKDNYEFYMDGEQLDGVVNYPVRAGDPWHQPSQYWEWRQTSIGFYDLEEGDHIFTVKVTGADCNCDCFTFDVLSYGEFMQHPAAYGNINMNGLGTYTMEAENIDMFYYDDDNILRSYIVNGDGVGDGYYGIVEDHAQSNGRYVNRFNSGSKFNLTVYSEKDATVDISMRANGSSNMAISQAVTLSVDDQSVPVTAQTAFDAAEWRTTELATGVTITGGVLHTITLAANDAFSLDCITLATSKYGADESALKSIRLDTTGVQTEYTVNDEFSTEGLKVYAEYTNGSSEPVELGQCQITEPDMSQTGDKQIAVTYNEQTAEYTIHVYNKPESLTLNTEGAKTEFEFGETFSSEGVTVTANVGEVTRPVDLSLCEVSTPNMYKVGQQDVTVTYMEVSQTYQITVKGVETPDATVNAESEPVVVEAENLDLSGIVKDAGNYTENWNANDKSGVSLRGICAGSVIKIFVQADAATTVNFKSSMSKYEALDVKDMFTLSLDGEDKTVPSLVLGRVDGNDWFNWKDVDFGDFELSEGLHVFVLTFIQAGPNIDNFTFTVDKGE